MVTGPGVAPYDNELHRSEDMQRKLEAKINGMCDLLHQRLGQVKEDLEKVQAETARLGAAVGHGAMSNTSVKEQLDNFHELIDLVSRKQKEVQSSIKAQCGVLDEKVDDGLSELRARAEAAEGRLLLVESRLREQHEGSGKLEAFAKEQREAIRTALESAESMQDGRMAHYEEALTQMRADIADAARSRQEILECARAEQDQTLAKVQSSYDSIALRLETLEQDVERLHRSLAPLPKRLDQCDEELQRVEQALKEERDRVHGFTDELQETQAGVKRFQDRHEKLYLAHNIVQDCMKNLQQDLAMQQEAVDRVSRDVVSRHQRTDVHLQGETERIGEAIRSSENRLGQRIAQAEADARLVREQVLTASESRAASLEGRVGSLEGRAATLDGNVAACEGRISSLEVAGGAAEQRHAEAMRRVNAEINAKLGDEQERLLSEVASARQGIESRVGARMDAAEQRITRSEHRLGEVEARQGESQRHLFSNEQRFATQDQQLLSHDKDLRQLADQCRDLSKAIDIKVGEVRAATKEDISAHALSAFQGEVKLLAKMAQISQQSMQPPQAQRQPPTYPEGYVWPPPMPPAPCGFLPGSVPMHGAK